MPQTATSQCLGSDVAIISSEDASTVQRQYFACSGDGQFLALGIRDRWVQVVNLGQINRYVMRLAQGAVTSSEASPFGTVFTIVDADKQRKCFDRVDSYKSISALNFDGSVLAISYVGSSTVCLFSTGVFPKIPNESVNRDDSRVKFIGVATVVSYGANAVVDQIVFSPDGQWLAIPIELQLNGLRSSVCLKKISSLLDIAKKAVMDIKYDQFKDSLCVHLLDYSSAITGRVGQVAFSADGAYVAAAFVDGIKIWRMRDVQGAGPIRSYAELRRSTLISTSMYGSCDAIAGITFDQTWDPADLPRFEVGELAVSCTSGPVRLIYPFWRLLSSKDCDPRNIRDEETSRLCERCTIADYVMSLAMSGGIKFTAELQGLSVDKNIPLVFQHKGEFTATDYYKAVAMLRWANFPLQYPYVVDAGLLRPAV